MMFISLLPIKMKKLLKEIEELGFILTLVGGGPRDFFKSKKVSRDLDFEIRSKSPVSEADWAMVYKKLHHFFKTKSIEFDELPYLITRVSYLGFDLEFSSPRLEKDIKDRLGHHHFEARLLGNLDYESAFRRRDFTINAIGIEFNLASNKERYIDPFKGRLDLKKKQLKNIDDYFFSDSVRFLRLVRFTILFSDFKIDENLKKNIYKFNLEHLSAHHFKSEMKKSKDYGQFFNLFFDLAFQYNLIIPQYLTPFANTLFSDDIKTSEDLLIFTFALNKKLAEEISAFFNFPKKELAELKSFMNSFELLTNTKQSDLDEIVALPMEKALASPILKEMKNLEDKKRWKDLMGIKDSSLIISWKKWEKVVVSKEEIELVKPEQRSYLRFYKAIKNL